MNPQQPYDPNNPNNQTPQPQNQPAPNDLAQPQVPLSGQADTPFVALKQPADVPHDDEHSGSKKPLMLAMIAGGVMIAIIAIVGVLYALSSTSPNPTPTPVQNDSNANVEALEPATAIELEQINNSINQDLSKLDDERDYPTASLDDETLEL